ncbi:hypothetical protein C5470_19180 [Photorhabdus stackebrandtii]|uniref:Uncharacterized protein n=1 Tax=Photorhabdus stackebrandtii TaxID=1123042 RepID=A0A7X5TLS9_9GAMM|nr:hypothetical protein [Photorhabdus stackebrandtii]
MALRKLACATAQARWSAGDDPTVKGGEPKSAQISFFPPQCYPFSSIKNEESQLFKKGILK